MLPLCWFGVEGQYNLQKRFQELKLEALDECECGIDWRRLRGSC